MDTVYGRIRHVALAELATAAKTAVGGVACLLVANAARTMSTAKLVTIATSGHRQTTLSAAPMRHVLLMLRMGGPLMPRLALQQGRTQPRLCSTTTGAPPGRRAYPPLPIPQLTAVCLQGTTTIIIGRTLSTLKPQSLLQRAPPCPLPTALAPQTPRLPLNTSVQCPVHSTPRPLQQPHRWHL